MTEEKMKLPSRERVSIVGGLYPHLMEIADPNPDPWLHRLFEELTKEELIKVIEVGIKYQNKLVEVEIGGLKAKAEALGELQKALQGFKR